MLKRVLISGASGLIGSFLIRVCEANRISVSRLLRDSRQAGPSDIVWNPLQPPFISDLSQLENFDLVIHLSGANLTSHRWTDAYKREILESRTKTTSALSTLLAALKNPPHAFLCASATGVYGDASDAILTEDSPPGKGFLAEVCTTWEQSAQPAKSAGIRVIHMRFGVVLSPDGGALQKMLPLFRAGLGGKLGSGRQWINWITLHDLARAVLHSAETDSLQDPVNFVAPNPVTNAELTRTLGRVLHRPTILPAPAFALRLAFGEMADETVLTSTRALPARLTASGFAFDHPSLSLALEALLR